MGQENTQEQIPPEKKYEKKLHTLQKMAYPGGDVPRPTPNRNNLRVYAHNLCPFSGRAIYSMAAKKISFQEAFVDLNNLAPWYAPMAPDGCDPIVENALGDIVPGEKVVAQFALEMGKGRGIELMPEDPFECADMEVAMLNFDNIVKPLFMCYLSRFEDTEKLDAFTNNLLPKFEEMATKAGDKWLWGTDEVTFYDFYVGSVWEFFYCFKDAPACAEGFARINLEQNAPNWLKYVERFREHWAVKPHRNNIAASHAQAERMKTWPKGEKCHFSLDVLRVPGAFPEVC